MADEAVDSFQRRVLGLQLRAWLTFIVAFVVGFAITAVLWTIVAGRDVQTMLTLLQTVLTFLTLVAALVAVIYARDSVRSANDTAKIMDGMASNLATAASFLDRMDSSLAATAETMQRNLMLTERGRQEDRLVHRLEQYERVIAAVTTMERAQARPTIEMHEGQAALRAALAPLPPDQLPRCHDASTATVTPSHLASADMEIEQALIETRAELDDLLGAAAL